MIQEIIKDPCFLSIPSTDATIEDQAVIQDLLDTLKAHEAHCVGMAANMIGVSKRIIVILIEKQPMILVNPEIIKTSSPCHNYEEGCLCHKGVRTTSRYEKIKVAYLDMEFHKKIKTFQGFSAQIIQHEIDHCNGILI